MDYGELSRNLIADAIQNQMPGISSTVVFHFLISQGDYDADSGTYQNTISDSDPIPCVVARPSFEEVQGGQVVATDLKLIVPGKFMTREIDTQVTATLGTQTYTCYKGKSVPGGAVVLVFLRLV